MEEPQMDIMLEHAGQSIKNHDISLALQYLLQAAENKPEDVGIIKQVAHCYYVLGEFDRARACWELILVTDPADTEATQASADFNTLGFQFWLKRYREAVAELENRNYQKAGDMLSDLITEQDGFVSLYQLLGMCYFAESDIEAARRVWSRGLSLDIANPVLLKYLALRREDAEDISTEADSKRDWNWPLRSAAWLLVAGLGIFLLVQTGLGLFRLSERSAIPVGGREANGMQASGLISSRGMDGRQLQSLTVNDNSSQEVQKGQEEQYYEKGYNAYLKNDWSEACRNLGAVVAMNSGNYIHREALYYYAQSYYFRKDYRHAREFFEKYLAEYPGSDYADDSLYYLGCSALAQQEPTAARQAFTRLGEVDPVSGYFSTREYQTVMTAK